MLMFDGWIIRILYLVHVECSDRRNFVNFEREFDV